MKTTSAILAKIREHKTCSIAQLYRYFAAFHIAPIGVRQRPQLYPDDTAERILQNLGLAEPNGGKPANGSKLVSLRQLRAARGRAGAAK